MDEKVKKEDIFRQYFRSIAKRKDRIDNSLKDNHMSCVTICGTGKDRLPLVTFKESEDIEKKRINRG